MKAARFYGVEDIRVEDVQVPRIGDDEILLRTKAAFICGTDVRFYKSGNPGAGDGPLIAGHEMAGVIEKVGANITGYSIGDRIGVAPNYGCGVCDLCTAGNSHLCLSSKALGITADGAFAEFVRIPAEAVRQGNVAPLDECVSFTSAALAEPFSCVYNAYEKIGIHPGDRVLVIGAGPIGLMHIKMAFLAGAAQVAVTDLSESRLSLAKRLVPDLVTLPNENLLDRVKELSRGQLMNLVITAASVSAIQEQAFQYVGINGRVMFFGGLPKGRSTVSLDTNEIHYKQLTVAGTTRQSLRQYRTCLKLIESGRVKLDDLITAEAPLDDIVKVIGNVAAGNGLKSAIVI